MEQLSPASDRIIAANARQSRPCPSCGAQGVRLFYEVRDVPIENCSVAPTRAAALNVRRGDIALGLCERCGLITNTAFDPALQQDTSAYEDQQCFSPTFNVFARDLAERLIHKYDLHEKNIVEIGCGKGDFLTLLCDLGRNYGIGIDPLCPQEMAQNGTARVSFVRDHYSERYARDRSDLICCRHTLEHIHTPAAFVSTIRRAIGDCLDTVVFFEVPDVTRILRDLAFWDIYYEHCCYFSAGSLAGLFRSCGFEVIDLVRAYDDQYLLIEARATTAPSQKIHAQEERIELIAQDVARFAARIGETVKQWKQRLQQLHAARKRVVVWGSGSKCVGFLTNIDLEGAIEYVVDINPRRHEQYIPGVGRRIVAPEFLKRYQPDAVIVMNPIYGDEIQRMLGAIGVATNVIHFEDDTYEQPPW